MVASVRPSMVPRWAVVSAVFLATLGAAAIVSAGVPVLQEQQTACYTCHVTITTKPLTAGTFYNIIPPTQVPVPPGSVTAYTVRFQNEYSSDGKAVVATLDLTNAPSLQFAPSSPPIPLKRDGAITVDATQPTTPQGSAVIFAIPEGATSVAVTMKPGQEGGEGPDLTMRIFGNQASEQPTGEPTVAPVNDAGRGQAETHTYVGTELAQLGAGNWSVEARYTPLNITDPQDPQPPVASGQVGFTVDVLVSFDTADLRQLTLSTRELIKPNGARLFTWLLTSAGAVGPTEHASVTMNATLFHLHRTQDNVPKPDGDWGNFTKEVDVPVVDEGMPTLKLEAGTIINTGPRTSGVSIVRIGEAIGYGSAFLMISSIASGGMFGKASRRGLNTMFGAAKRRVAFHNGLSYALTILAAIHLTIFVVDKTFYWTRGILFGGLSILSMFGLGVTGALQIPMIRKWNYGVWRWTHYIMTITALLFLVVHILLEGVNMPFLSEALGYHDPLDPRDIAA